MLIDFEKLKIKGTSVRSLEIRELTGDDSELAAARVVNSTTSPTASSFMLNRAHNEQCIADSIIKVDGKPVVTPYVDWKKWNLRTREFVINAYNKINAASIQEMDDFFKALGLVDAPESPAAGA